MRKTSKRLALTSEQIRRLSGVELRRAHGAAINTGGPNCEMTGATVCESGCTMTCGNCDTIVMCPTRRGLCHTMHANSNCGCTND